ncbi:MAG: hypothetical protein KAR13_20095, partial [Desulfobulbaceae bacterium]|nr:hypothetical protein [Desulfobulbaceae bacterium]
GNKEMVEKNVRELDTLNREVIQQIPELPSDGHVRVKARITQTGVKREIDILHTEIILPDSVDTATTTSTSVIEQTEVIPTETTESQETRKQEINFNDHHQKVSPN